MNVLIISSSPRKGGNSDLLCEQFAKGAAEAGHEVEKVNLREKKLSPCRACYGCMKDHVCSIRDDMAEIFPKLVSVDPEEEAADGTLAAFRGFLRCLPDAKEAGVIYGTGTWEKGDVYQHPVYAQAYEMGRRI